MKVKNTVNKLVNKYGTNNPFELVSKHNILIYRKPLGNILGYYTTQRRVQMIYLNENIEEQQMERFVCAHELAHAILHPKLNTPFLRSNTLFSVDKVEREANTFAVELLVPDEDVYVLSDDCATVREAAVTYGLPHEFMRLKTFNNTRYS